MALDQEAEIQASPKAPSVRTIAASISWVFVGRVFQQLSSYATLLVLAAFLPPSAFGTVAVAIAIIGIAELLMESGTTGSIIATRNLTAEHLRASFLLNLAAGLLLTALIALSAEMVATVFADGGDASAIRVMSVILTFAALAIIPDALLTKTMRFRRSAAVWAATTTMSSVAAIAVALAGAGVWALVTRYVLNPMLFAIFGWIAVWKLLPRQKAGRDQGRRGRLQRPKDTFWFLALAGSTMLALSLDNLVVGAATDATQLGLYALAFTIGFAPLTQFSWQLGAVLFPAVAATPDLETVVRRTTKTARLVALFVLPLAPPVLVLAPVIVPAVFGDEWRDMVVPFQILFVAAVGHAVTSVIGESLSGTGNIAFRVRIDAAWAIGTFAAILVLVHLEGIRGAAVGHLALFVPLAIAYGTIGMRRIGGDARGLWRALQGVLASVVAEALVTLAALAALRHAGLGPALAAAGAALAGLIAVAAALLWVPSKPLADAREILVRALRGESTA